jgi:hypothetical protein
MTISFIAAFAALAALAAVAMAGNDGEPDAANSASTYRHPSGAQLRLASGWTTRGESGVTLLVPPASGQTEAYLMLITGTQGATRADDPRVAQALEGEIAQLAPFLRRDGAGESFRTEDGASGAVTSFVGRNDDGLVVRARAYVVIGPRYAVAVLALGEKSAVDPRDDAVRQMLATTSFGEGRRERALLGYWKFSKSSSYTSGEFTAATQVTRELVLAPDGTCAARESSRAIGGDMSASVDTGDDADVTRGHWFAADGVICIVLENGQGAMSLQYELTGTPGSRTLTLVAPSVRRVYYEQ